MNCANCFGPNDRQVWNGKRVQSYCRTCHADRMRRTRRKHADLSDEQKKRANARSYANVYQRRGLLIAEPCETCGATAEKHHENYDHPLHVRWLCRKCHITEHAQEP